MKDVSLHYRSLFDVMGKHPHLWIFVKKLKLIQREEEKSVIRSGNVKKIQQARRKYNKDKEEVIRNLKANYEQDNDHEIFLEELWKWQGAGKGG